MDAVIAGSLLWALIFGAYALLGVFITVAPAIVVQTADLQQQSVRFLKRLPIVAVALWVILVAVNFIYPLDLCVTCETGARFPWLE